MHGTVGDIVATEEGARLMVEALAEGRLDRCSRRLSAPAAGREGCRAMLTEAGQPQQPFDASGPGSRRRTEAEAIVGDMLAVPARSASRRRYCASPVPARRFTRTA